MDKNLLLDQKLIENLKAIPKDLHENLFHELVEVYLICVPYLFQNFIETYEDKNIPQLKQLIENFKNINYSVGAIELINLLNILEEKLNKDNFNDTDAQEYLQQIKRCFELTISALKNELETF